MHAWVWVVYKYVKSMQMFFHMTWPIYPFIFYYMSVLPFLSLLYFNVLLQLSFHTYSTHTVGVGT